MHIVFRLPLAINMDGTEAACDLLDDLLAAIRLASAATVAALPTCNIALALRYIETDYDVQKAEQRAVAGCAYLCERLAMGWLGDRISTARLCAAEAVEALREQVAVAPLTQLAASLAEF